MSGREKERAKKEITHPKKGGALKRGAQTSVWVEFSLMFQLCIIVGSYVDISSGYSNLLVLIVGMVKSVRKKMVHCYNCLGFYYYKPV